MRSDLNMGGLVQGKTPEKRATEALQVGCLATLRDTLGAPNELQNESRNRLRNGPEMSPKPDPQEEAKVSPNVMCPQAWHSSPGERPSINFNDV